MATEITEMIKLKVMEEGNKMGWADCRFKDEAGCKRNGSAHILLDILDSRDQLNIPIMWEHYTIDHKVQPNVNERSIIMNLSADKVRGRIIQTRSVSGGSIDGVPILYVEKTEKGYSHNVGEDVDWRFVEKLDSLLTNSVPDYKQRMIQESNQGKPTQLYRGII